MPGYHLAQINIAEMKAPLHMPLMKTFVDQIAKINDLAEASPGFVWRLKDQYGDATSIRPFGCTILVNMSVWETPEHLMDYAYKSAHKVVMQNRKEWFDSMDEAHFAMWWIEAGYEPTIDEAKVRLEHLFAHGETEHAFTFKQVFAKPTP